MSEILFAADLHSQKGAWADRPIHGDAHFAFDQILALAKKKRVEAVVLGGDLCDQQVNRAGPPIALYRFVSGLAEAGVLVYDVQGQHDIDKPRWLAGAPSCHLDRFRATLPCGLALYGLDWRPADKLAEELAQIPDGADVLVAHQVWAEWMGGITNPEGKLDEVPKVRAVWTGDLHQLKREQILVFPDRTLCAVSPGAVCKQAIDDPDEHYVLLYDTAKPVQAASSYKAVKLRSRPVVRLDVTEAVGVGGDDQTDAAVAVAVCEAVAKADRSGLPEALHAPLVRLLYPAERTGLLRLVRAALTREGLVAHLFPKPVGSIRPAGREEGHRPATVWEALPAALPRDEYPREYALAERLLRGGDRYQTTIDEWCDEFAAPAAGG